MLKKRIAAVVLMLALVCGLFGPVAAPVSAAGYELPEGVTVHAPAAILVSLAGNPDNDVVLYEKEADMVHAPGSMMRYMVLAYALTCIQEQGLNLDRTTGTYTNDLFNNYVAGTGVNTANMNFGETWTLRDLLTVSFMQSASDAVAVLATTLSGSVPAFVEGMNQLAETLGCDYSHFANLTGVDSLSQYTTARDMYRIVRYCQSFSEFEDLAVAYQVTVKPKKGGSERTIWSANNLLQPSSPYRYSPIVHSRTGLSEHEGRTCASVARDSGYEYLVVVMGCPEQNKAGETNLHYLDTIALMKWGFSQFEYKTVLGKSEILSTLPVELNWNTDHVNLVPAKEVSTVVDANMEMGQIIRKITVYEKSVKAPVEKGTVYGKVELIININQKIGEADLVAAESLSSNWILVVWSKVSGFFSSVWFYLGLALLVALIVAYVVLNIVHNRRRRRQRQRINRK